jgi:16S rRNA (guanine966-N2)-methyltransferase
VRSTGAHRLYTVFAMRVIAGSHRGRTLHAPRGRETRPTSDRVREALFSILGEIDGATVLDLFAGSGALAIEALSRGASNATLVDCSPGAIEAIRRNLEALSIDAEVVRSDAVAWCEQAKRRARQYDLVFLDPPYRHGSLLGEQLTAALAGALAPEARVVAESDRRDPLGLELPLLDERRYGDTLIQIYGPH